MMTLFMQFMPILTQGVFRGTAFLLDRRYSFAKLVPPWLFVTVILDMVLFYKAKAKDCKSKKHLIIWTLCVGVLTFLAMFYEMGTFCSGIGYAVYFIFMSAFLSSSEHSYLKNTIASIVIYSIYEVLYLLMLYLTTFSSAPYFYYAKVCIANSALVICIINLVRYVIFKIKNRKGRNDKSI